MFHRFADCRSRSTQDNYWWGRGVPDHVSYEAGTDTVDFQIAFGALPNHHCVLDTLNPTYPVPPYQDNLVNRYKDPGAGAFSYSMGREFSVLHPLKAGSEVRVVCVEGKVQTISGTIL